MEARVRGEATFAVPLQSAHQLLGAHGRNQTHYHLVFEK